MSLQPQTRLTSLPNELLEIICSFVPVWSIFPGKRRSIYAVSARTNRQLRSFALAFFFSKISAKLSKLRERTKFVEDAGYLDAVRCLRLGSRDFSRAMPIGDFSPVQDLPELPGLQELISMDHPLDYPTLHSLAMKSKYQSRLQHLSLSWNDDRLPDIQEWFPQLKTLCLSLYEPVHLDFPVSAPNITSLAVCHHRLSSEICASFRSCFPNLRSPALYQTSTEITELFSIIETTPSLCEVTYRPSTAEIILLGHLIPVIVGDSSFRIEDLTVPPFHWPAHYSWRNVEFVDLAFVRKPVECSVDNSGPRYSLISLSLELRSETGEKDDLMEILSDFPSQPGLAHIEELCLAPVIYSEDRLTFKDYMSLVAHSLRQWPCLRRFALAGNLLGRCDWSLSRNRYVEFLDDIAAPSMEEPLDGAEWIRMDEKKLTVKDVERYYVDKTHEDYQEFVSEILEILGLPEDAELDPSLELMPIWEARHEPEVMVAVRRMAELRPTLQEFVWYIDDTEALKKQNSWNWKVLRKQDGSVDHVAGSLFWPESFRPPFPPFADFALVGEERQSAEKHGWPKSAFCRSH